MDHIISIKKSEILIPRQSGRPGLAVFPAVDGGEADAEFSRQIFLRPAALPAQGFQLFRNIFHGRHLKISRNSLYCIKYSIHYVVCKMIFQCFRKSHIAISAFHLLVSRLTGHAREG